MSNLSESKQVARLLRGRKEVRAAGGDLRELNQQIRPYRARYVRAGTPYGKTYAGMLKWFRAQVTE